MTLLLTLCLAGPAAAETRVALVIGINAYENAPPLANPVNDAQAIGDALRRLNFEVEELHDPDFRALIRGVRDFGIRAQKADTALVYYAGHGVQVDRENYLIPADAKLERARDLAYEALPLSLLLDEAAQAGKIGIVLLDSCRNNPFIDRVSRAMSVSGRAVATTPGLARVDNVPRNTMVVMAAKADQIAEDGQEHSPFAAAILAHFQIPGLELGLFFRSVRDAVLKATQNRQEPYVFSSLGAEPFYFYPRPPNRPPVIGPIPTLFVADTAGPTPLGIPAPTDPDLDPLIVRIIGLPRGGEVRVEGRKPALGEAFSVDHFLTGTFKPDGTLFGPVGTLDVLVEDGRGGSVTGSLPVVVSPTSQTPKPEAAAAPPVSSQTPVTGKTEPEAAKPTGTTAAAVSLTPPTLTPQSRAPASPAPATPSPATSSPATPAPATPSPANAFGLAEARSLAFGVPCALLDVVESQTSDQPVGLVVSGPMLPGAAFDAFVRQLDMHGYSVAVTTEPLDPGHCAALAAVTDLVRHSRRQGALRLAAPAAPVPVGGQLVIAAETIPGGALYVDLYAADGTVLHLRRGTGPGNPAEAEATIAAAASGPPGQRLLVAITTATPLNLAQRPASESQTAYLPVLRQELVRLGSASVQSRAEVAMLSIIAASRPVAVSSRPASPVSHASNPRCQDIVARVMLGDTLSDADRATLRTSCGR